MAGRPPKKGIDYAGWSVDIFDNDTKIDKLLEARGWEGFGIYFYLCQRAYGGDGYFYRWSYDDSASTSRKMGCGISAGTVRETVGYCLHIGLFDKGLFDRQGILTSRGIQRRYWEVVKARDVRTVISDYWLLQDDECKGLIKTQLNTNYPAGNTNYPAGNTNYPAGNTNYPAINESKVNKKICAPEPHDQDDQLIKDFEIIYGIYPKKIGRTVAFANYKQWISSKGKDIGGKRYRLTNKQIYMAVKKYVRQQEESGNDDLQYWKNFDTLMGRQLLDYVDFEVDKK